MSNIHIPSVGSIVIPVFSLEHVKALLYLCPPNTWWRPQSLVGKLAMFGTE
jgi:hypothetical protein